MVYSQKTPWTLIRGLIVVAYARAVQSGAYGSGHQVPRHRLTRRRNADPRFMRSAASPSRSGCGNSSPIPQRATSTITSPRSAA